MTGQGLTNAAAGHVVRRRYIAGHEIMMQLRLMEQKILAHRRAIQATGLLTKLNYKNASGRVIDGEAL